ncbi:hypothetical protein DN824_17690 [Stutzerimonas nosocomialis]|uniref:DUF1493 family protein n=1 Tax=Stutzerimonas nosocomialis TaxID=1056496 RepID=UPI00110875FA|nr:DUF1493 family protein [Stutzerimonas nosocomialis]TLX55775.1 hypothetical protein DN824_17690 [Stutzerimonas nosocomialis]
MNRHAEFLELVQKHKRAQANFSLSSKVVGDLGIDGDDAEELIEELNTKLQPQRIDVNWLRYFHTEAELLSWSYYLKLLTYKVGIRKKPALRHVDPLTVEKLMELYNAPV